jgi:hypothetical protein
MERDGRSGALAGFETALFPGSFEYYLFPSRKLDISMKSFMRKSDPLISSASAIR